MTARPASIVPRAPRRARLRASPNFVLATTPDGRAFVEETTEPYRQFWLSERERTLHGLFAAPRGATVETAVAAYGRLVGGTLDAAARRRLQRTVDSMRAAGVLVRSADDPSRYDADIVEAYLAHRPFPRDLAAHIARVGAIGPRTRVLDLAGGPGDLALRLAEISSRVTLMELSRGFATAAKQRAAIAGLPLAVLHESANRLRHDDGTYDVVTCVQALPWLDDVAVCRGVARVLAPGGSFLVVQSAIEIDDAHPLAFVLGRDSILGARRPEPFAAQCAALERRLGRLFEALHAPAFARDDAAVADASMIVPVGVTLFRQTRPFDAGFARAFLTPRHLAAAGIAPAAFWQDVDARCANAARPDALLGVHEWAVIRCVRGPAEAGNPVVETRDIAWDGASSSLARS